MSTRLLIACTLLLSLPALAQNPEACRTPRAAAQTFLDNLQPDTFAPQRAIACFERPEGMADAQLIERARDLKAVLDHRGLYVIMEDLPTERDHKDERGRLQVQLVAGFAPVYLRRIGGEWQFPTSVVQRVPQLYAETFSAWIDSALKHLPPALRVEVLGYQLWQPIALAALLLLCLVVSRLVRVVVRSRLVRLLSRLHVEAASDALALAARPIGLLAAAGLFALALPELRLPIGAARVMFIVAKVAAAWAGVLLAYRLVDIVVAQLAARAEATDTRTDDQLVVLLRKILRVLVAAVGLVFILQNLNVDVTSLLAGLGIGGLALALAAKDTAANLFGSITILIDQPFHVGDWIKVGSVEGTVVEIGLRSTRVRSFYDSEVSVPNSKLANSDIDNYSRRNYRRFKTVISLSYDATAAQIQAFVEGTRAIIARHPDTRKDAYEVAFIGYADSWLEIMVYTFFQVPGWSQELIARQDLLLEIKRLAEDVGVEFAFPTQTMHVESVAEPRARPEATPPGVEALTALVHTYGPKGERGRPGQPPLTNGYFAGVSSARGDEDGG